MLLAHYIYSMEVADDLHVNCPHHCTSYIGFLT